MRQLYLHILLVQLHRPMPIGGLHLVFGEECRSRTSDSDSIVGRKRRSRDAAQTILQYLGEEITKKSSGLPDRIIQLVKYFC